MSEQNKRLVLVDGSSYLYRAFHALPALTNSKGSPTGAVYGMVNMLRRLISDHQPDYMAVVFDAKGKTFRDELYADYKATRQSMPPELVAQIEPIHQIIRAMGLPLVMVEGVEADDVIATLAAIATSKDVHTLISTGDKDLAQLVDDHVTLINTMNNTQLDRAGVIAKFGVPPERIVDYLTLVGDTSDNVPGVNKVGPKTAAKWLQTYQSLENLLAHAADITGKVGENLRAFIPQIPLTQTLVTVKRDVPLPVDYAALKIEVPDNQQLITLYKEMEFKTWLAELLEKNTDVQEEKRQQYTLITTPAQLEIWVKKLSQASVFAFDTETTALDYMRAALVGISLAVAPGDAAYIPLMHDYPDAPAQLDKTWVLDQLKPLFIDPRIKKVAQNLKYDMAILANEGITLQGVDFDTMLESYVLDSVATRHDMDSLALKYLGWRTISYSDVAGTGSKQIPFNHVTVEKALAYAAEDADVTLQLHLTLWPRLSKEPTMQRVYTDIEMPLVPVLSRMERGGVLIDPQLLTEQGKSLQLRLEQIETEAYQVAGKHFNLNSPKQLQAILFDELHLPILQKTPTGQASTADHILQELAIEFALPRLIIEYRSLSKLISTYTSKLVTQINPRTGRIHTSYNQAGTATGRLSSSEPNLQNIPVRTAEGRRIRQAFIAPPGYKIMSADYSQIELRIMAHLSQDPSLIQAFKQNLDIHQATAAEVFGVALNDVTDEMRYNAKAINFGLIYGMSAFGLTRQLGIDRKAAQDYIDRYFARYPGVKAYMENTRQHAKEKGYVETLWGRRLYLPDINARQIPRQKAAERIAINAPLQGSAADIIKIAMIRINTWLEQQQVDAKMIMQVHDELVFEVNASQLEAVAEGVTQHMTSGFDLCIPLLVSLGTGDNWDASSS